MPDREEPAQVFGEWRRTGYCCRCGACCQAVDSPTGYCPLFTLDWDHEREGFRGCCNDRTVSNDTYTKGCFEFPSHPSQIVDYPLCTYKFERVADGR